MFPQLRVEKSGSYDSHQVKNKIHWWTNCARCCESSLRGSSPFPYPLAMGIEPPLSHSGHHSTTLARITEAFIVNKAQASFAYWFVCCSRVHRWGCALHRTPACAYSHAIGGETCIAAMRRGSCMLVMIWITKSGKGNLAAVTADRLC